MEQQEKRPYAAPKLTSVTFKTEHGYANSGEPLTLISISNTISLMNSSAVSRDSYGSAADGGWNWE